MFERHYSAPPESSQTETSPEPPEGVAFPQPLTAEEWRAAARGEVLRAAREFLNNPRVAWTATAGGAMEAEGLSHAWARLFPPPRGADPGLPPLLEIRETREAETFALGPDGDQEAADLLRALWAKAAPAGELERERREAFEARRRARVAGRIADALRTERRGRWLVGDAGEALSEIEAAR